MAKKVSSKNMAVRKHEDASSSKKPHRHKLPASFGFGLSTKTPAKLTGVVVCISVVSLLLLQKSDFIKTFTANETAYDSEDDLSNVDLHLGGWRPADDDVMQKYGSTVCNIERVSVKDLTPERFETEFRFKKPILVTFPRAAQDWTDPLKWSRQSLVKDYGSWSIRQGQSLEIVRAGGNAKHSSSFVEFVDKLINHNNGSSQQM